DAKTYKVKTNWATDVKGGKFIRSVAKDRNIDRSTLWGYMIKKNKVKEVKTVGYSGTAEAKRVFREKMMRALEIHIKKLADQNNIPVPNNWKEKGLANRVYWFKNFMACYHLSCHLPEATPLERAAASNKTTVGSSLTIWLK
uniref:Uncharacterized protein n=1 Tax=Scleropages formosus TaxID=113540 RepID=A0A8C9V9M5_SCLFO